MPSRNISQCLESVQELILLSGIATSGAFRVQTKSAVLHLRECAHNLLNNPYEMKQQDMASHCLAMEKSLFTSHPTQENNVSSDPPMFHLLVEQNKRIDCSIKDEKSIKAVVTASYSGMFFLPASKTIFLLLTCFVSFSGS